MAQSPMALRVIAARQGKEFRVARRRVSFPLTPALSLGERVKHSPLGEQSREGAFPLREARFSLSQRERGRVRGNGASSIPRIGSITEPSNSETSGKAGGFPR